MALAKIGAKRIDSLSDTAEDTLNARQCRLHYEQTRDALIRSHTWRFAMARVELSENTNAPAFEWDNAFDLPNNFLRHRSIYEDNNTTQKNVLRSYAIEGKQVLSNDSTVELRYVKKVTDPAEFDPLFIEVLIQSLALKMVMPLSQDKVLHRDLIEEMKPLMSKVRTMDRQETNNFERHDLGTWNDARLANDGRIDSKLGSA
jgi:hypothetical protein